MTLFRMIWKSEKGEQRDKDQVVREDHAVRSTLSLYNRITWFVLQDKDHVRAERVHVCMTAHGRLSAEEARLFGPGPGPNRPAQHPSYGQDE